MTNRVNAGMRALGSVVGKGLNQVQTNQAQAAAQAATQAAQADSGKVAEALQEVARAIDRLAEAVRSLRGEAGE